MSKGDGGGAGVVSLSRVRRAFTEGSGRREVLRGVNLCIDRGEWVVLLGRSGCGKSTLLNVVAGIDLPDSGRVTVAGQRLDTLSERARTLVRRRSLGFVFQFFNLVSTLTVQENLMLPLELNRWNRRDARRRVAETLDSVGLGDRAASFPDMLSGGEQQRVALARAVVHRPALVLADEPTGNLDEETGGRVLDVFGALMREQGTTLLMATHSRDVAARAERVLTLHDGRLAMAAESRG